MLLPFSVMKSLQALPNYFHMQPNLVSIAGAIPTGYEKNYKFLRTDYLFPAQVFYPGH